jgi:hypothetical protein
MFDRGRPFGWSMSVQGTRERVLDSVLPHEVTHTIFATHFGRPLPRWADEGACTTVEHSAERKKQEDNLVVFLTTNRGIAFNQMFAMTEYPKDVLPLYSQGYSLARFLIAQGGKPKFVKYVGDGMKSRNWTKATREHYGFESLSELQLTWVEWVRAGSRDDDAADVVASLRGKKSGDTENVRLASNETKTTQVKPASIEQLAGSETGESRPQGGWYARKRDESRTTLQVRSKGSSPGALGAQPLDTSREALPEAIQTARPQPLARPTPTVIEWSRPPEKSTAPRGNTILR